MLAAGYASDYFRGSRFRVGAQTIVGGDAGCVALVDIRGANVSRWEPAQCRWWQRTFMPSKIFASFAFAQRMDRSPLVGLDPGRLPSGPVCLLDVNRANQILD